MLDNERKDPFHAEKTENHPLPASLRSYGGFAAGPGVGRGDRQRRQPRKKRRGLYRSWIELAESKGSGSNQSGRDRCKHVVDQNDGEKMFAQMEGRKNKGVHHVSQARVLQMRRIQENEMRI